MRCVIWLTLTNIFIILISIVVITIFILTTFSLIITRCWFSLVCWKNCHVKCSNSSFVKAVKIGFVLNHDSISPYCRKGIVSYLNSKILWWIISIEFSRVCCWEISNFLHITKIVTWSNINQILNKIELRISVVLKFTEHVNAVECLVTGSWIVQQTYIDVLVSVTFSTITECHPYTFESCLVVLWSIVVVKIKCYFDAPFLVAFILIREPLCRVIVCKVNYCNVVGNGFVNSLCFHLRKQKAVQKEE